MFLLLHGSVDAKKNQNKIKTKKTKTNKKQAIEIVFFKEKQIKTATENLHLVNFKFN